MPGRLTLHPAERPVLRCCVSEGRDYVLGRGADCDLVVEDDRVSRRHARLSSQDGAWRLTDLGSKNGMSIDGFATAEGALGSGSWFSLGGVVGRFDEIGEEAMRSEAESRASRWRVSAEHHQRLDPHAGVDALLGQILASVLELSGGERGFVLLDRAGELEVAAATGLGVDELRLPEFEGSVGAVARALELGRSIVVADLAHLEGGDSLAARPSVASAGIRALACVPLAACGRPLGALYTDSRRVGAAFEALDLELLEAFAGHAALALEAARLDRELARLAAELPRVTLTSEARPQSSASVSTSSNWREVLAAHSGSISGRLREAAR